MISASSCRFGGHKYAQSAEVCTEEKCMVCSSSEWEVTDESLYPADYPERLFLIEAE